MLLRGMSGMHGGANPITAGSSGRSVTGMRDTMPMTAHRSGRFRAAICRVFAMLAMTMWLTLLLLCSAWTRPIGETAQVWIASLPLFLLFDFLRCKAAPERGAYFAWLSLALATVRRGELPQPMPGRLWRLVVCYGPLWLLILYVVVFILVPEWRGLGEALERASAVRWTYQIMGAWFPTVVKEPAHILKLGHPREAADLEHFISAALIFSLIVTFIAAGPGRREFLEWWLFKRLERAARKTKRGLSDQSLFRIAIGQTILGGIGLAMFAAFNIGNSNSPVYWGLDPSPPCLMFMMESWLFSWGISATSVLNDVASAQRGMQIHSSSS